MQEFTSSGVNILLMVVATATGVYVSVLAIRLLSGEISYRRLCKRKEALELEKLELKKKRRENIRPIE